MNAPTPPFPSMWQELLPGGCHWSARLRRGTALRLQALADGANVSAVFYSAEQPLERYNMPDTLKTQHTGFLAAGHVCHSDMGRVLCALTASSLPWHDAFCGPSDAPGIAQRHGPSHYQTHRNAMHRNGRDGLLVELAKHGLGPRDLVPCINFFSKAQPDAAGGLQWVAGHARAGDHVDLRFEMDTLVLLSAAPHPLDPRTPYAPADIQLSAWRAPPVAADDPCRRQCPQNERAYVNTERHVGAEGPQ